MKRQTKMFQTLNNQPVTMKTKCLKACCSIMFLMITVFFTGCGKSSKSEFPVFPPDNVTSLMDRDQMLEQLNIELPVLPPKLQDPNAPPNTFPTDPDNPEGNWTDSLRNPDAPISRSIFGLWNNYSDKSSGMFPGPDSARLGDYTPIDLLKMKNGKIITTPEEWWEKRRPEIKKDIEDQMYGRIPPEEILPAVSWSVSTSAGGSGNSAYVQKEIAGTIDISRYPEVRNKPVIRATLRTPARTNSPVPVIIFFGGMGNVNDFYWERSSPHGWGTCVFDLTALQPDNGQGLTSYLIGLVNKGNWRKPTDWGSLAAWSWGVSRLIDYFETDKDVNTEIIGLNGVSRYGKATIVAMAYEPRIAIGFPGDAGSLGTKMNRRHWGQDLENSCDANEYHWMAGNFFKWAGELVPGQYLPRKIEECPVDAHSLLALCAPRPVFMNGGSTSSWCDPYGVFLSGVNATPVYELLGQKGLVAEDKVPVIDKAYIDGTIGYRVHQGGHSDAPNWPAFHEFAAKHFDIPVLNSSASDIILGSDEGSSEEFTVTSNKDWEITCPDEWLTIDAGSSSGSENVRLIASANTEKSGRSTFVTIKTEGREQTVNVNQASSVSSLGVVLDAVKGLTGRELEIGSADKSQVSLEIRSNTAWEIQIDYPEVTGSGARFMMGSGNWLSLSNTAGVNDKTVILTATENTTVEKRKATLSLSAPRTKPLIVEITQEKGAPTLDIMADTLSFDSEGGSAMPLFVMTNTTWNLTCSESWISASPQSGGNYGRITISAEENEEATGRSGEVIVSVEGLPPEVIIITQKGISENN
jgi:hypothetical protein